MIHAYDEIYLNKAQTVMGSMLDFAVNGLKNNLSDFFNLFIATGTASSFESGNPNTIAGKSGKELTIDVLNKANIHIDCTPVQSSFERTKEYWLGWSLAYYQWEKGIPFSYIIRRVSLDSILALYDPYHEMDIRQFRDKLDQILSDTNTETNLKQLRKKIGISQRDLAKLSGVPVRTIQQYEQRQKNINKAGTECIQKMSSALCCSPSELMEM